MISKKDIISILKNYNTTLESLNACIDTSKGTEDIRLNYLVNDKYFLKLTNNLRYDDVFYDDMNELIKKYHSIGIYCPSLIRTNTNGLFMTYIIENTQFTCHLEEKSKFQVLCDNNESDYIFKHKVVEHLGILASQYSNKDLSKIRSMWSIIELSLHDHDEDEKQQNFNLLCDALTRIRRQNLVEKLTIMNIRARTNIKNVMNDLPQAVYQGDLNESNLLIDEDGNFKGLIDFNMFGTEVNLNCFLNESMYYIEQRDFEDLSGKQIFEKMKNMQSSLLSCITKHYLLSPDEEKILKDYNRVIFSSFFPNVYLMVKLIEKGVFIDKIEDFLNELLHY